MAAQKKPKGRPLADGDKVLNGFLSSARIVVEHTLSGVKRARSVKDVLRNTKDGFSDLVMEVACALHNFRVDVRHPIPTLHLVALAS